MKEEKGIGFLFMEPKLQEGDFLFQKVKEDDRGIIWKIQYKNKDFWLSLTKKGKSRGGDIHSCFQYNAILTGSFVVRQKLKKEDKVSKIDSPSLMIIPPEVPHVFTALEDSLMIEWHSKKLPPYEEKRFYEPYRRMCT